MDRPKAALVSAAVFTSLLVLSALTCTFSSLLQKLYYHPHDNDQMFAELSYMTMRIKQSEPF